MNGDRSLAQSLRELGHRDGARPELVGARDEGGRGTASVPVRSAVPPFVAPTNYRSETPPPIGKSNRWKGSLGDVLMEGAQEKGKGKGTGRVHQWPSERVRERDAAVRPGEILLARFDWKGQVDREVRRIERQQLVALSKRRTNLLRHVKNLRCVRADVEGWCDVNMICNGGDMINMGADA